MKIGGPTTKHGTTPRSGNTEAMILLISSPIASSHKESTVTGVLLSIAIQSRIPLVDKLLKACPIKVTRDRISVGSSEYAGKDLAAYFTWPRGDSNIALVGVIAGTGLIGMNATDPNQYFAAGSGFPDYMIFSTDMLKVQKQLKLRAFMIISGN